MMDQEKNVLTQSLTALMATLMMDQPLNASMISKIVCLNFLMMALM
jgi:hypothetical protein